MEAYEFRKSQNIDVVAGKRTQDPGLFSKVTPKYV